jgi:hypothetical protein
MGKCTKAVRRLFEGIENFKLFYCFVIFHIPCCEFKIIHKRSSSYHCIRKLNLDPPSQTNGLFCDIFINGVDICKFDKLLAFLKTFGGMFFPSKKFYLR